MSDPEGDRLADLVRAWEHTSGALLALGRGCSDGDFERATECPGWTVKDQLSHVVGVERWMLGERDPDHPLPQLTHVNGAFARAVEVAVDLRRPVPGPQVVDELDLVRAARLQALATPSLSARSATPSPLGGTMPLADVLRLRTFDVWSHEQDVRRALDRPGDLDSPAAVVALQWIRRTLPRVVARQARTEPGRVVVLAVEGKGGFTDAVVVAAGEGGRTTGVVLPDVPDAADAVLRMSTEAFMRRSCGRWDVAATPVEVSGDPELAGRVLQALAVTP